MTPAQVTPGTFRRTEYQAMLERQIEDMRGTIDAMHIELRRAVGAVGGKKDIESSAYIFNLNQALCQADTHLCGLVTAAYAEQQLHVDLKFKQTIFNDFIHGVSRGNGSPNKQS